MSIAKQRITKAYNIGDLTEEKKRGKRYERMSKMFDISKTLKQHLKRFQN